MLQMSLILDTLINEENLNPCSDFFILVNYTKKYQHTKFWVCDVAKYPLTPALSSQSAWSPAARKWDFLIIERLVQFVHKRYRTDDKLVSMGLLSPFGPRKTHLHKKLF